MKISFFKKKDKYKKLSLRDENDFNVILDFIEKHKNVNLYRLSKNPIKESFEDIEKDSLELNCPAYFVNKRLFINNYSFDLSGSILKDSEIQGYVGERLIIKLPRGYKGDFVYYSIE